MLDDCSRYVLALAATGSTKEAAVREVLQPVFETCGVPQQMLMDHGCPWWNDQGIRGWTRLAIWLMKQDIQLYFSGYNHPQTQGKVEHFHRSLTAALLRRGTPPDAQRQTWLNEYRHEHNHLRPHQALDMKTPDQIWRKKQLAFSEEPCAVDLSARLRNGSSRKRRPSENRPPSPLDQRGTGRRTNRFTRRWQRTRVRLLSEHLDPPIGPATTLDIMSNASVSFSRHPNLSPDGINQQRDGNRCRAAPVPYIGSMSWSSIPGRLLSSSACFRFLDPLTLPAS